MSASLLGDELEKRRDQLRATLPIGRVAADGGRKIAKDLELAEYTDSYYDPMSSMHHPYRADHDRSPSAAGSPSAAAVPGGA